MNFLSPTWPSITSLKFLPPPPSAEEGGEPAPLSHLWTFCRISEATYARTVAKPLGIINEFMGLTAPAGAIWTRLVLVFSFSTGFLSRSHSFSLASAYPFCPSSSGARKARSAMIVAGAFSSCLQRGTDSDEAIRSPQT